MVPIGNGVLCLAIFINIIGTSLIIFFAFNEEGIRNLEEIPKKSFHKFNLRGSELKNNEIYFPFKNKDIYDINKINENISKVKLRSLGKFSNTEGKLILLIISGISIFFIINLILSVNYDDCCSNRGNSYSFNNSSNGISLTGDCGGGGGEAGAAILLLIAFILVIALFYMIQKTMGKKNAAYCSLISLSIIYMASSIICFGFIFFLIAGGISCGLSAFNFLIILIINLNWEYIFRCNDSKEIKLKEENINNNILINNQSITTPMINESYNKINNIEKPIENINRIDKFNNNNELYGQISNNYNEMLNLPNDTSNDRISDLSNAPLPNDVDLPTENEIYNNYSNL